MTVTTCKASESDAEHIFQLNRQLIERFEDFSVLDKARVLDWMNQNIHTTLPFFRRILADGELAGYYALVPTGKGYELDSFFVFPEFQRKGVGSFVLKQILAFSSQDIYLYVFRENLGAVRFYQQMGFRMQKYVSNTRMILLHPKK